MDTWVWLVVVVVLLVLVGLALAGARRRRTARVRERFGPEYDRAVTEHGGARAARQHLEDVAERRDAAQVRPLDPASRERYLARWQQVQADFVDHPGEAVDDADRLVAEVMTERGYPVDEGVSRAELVAADHPEVAEQLRAAQDARRRYHEEDGAATTEELRRAMVHYRELVTLLVDEGHEARHRG
ncbi:MAG: hypothetical protein ACLGIV_11745 [Actinomycetes bacterium]